MKIDLAKFTHTLPYASELFGIYQPLLGWKSKRIVKRIERGFSAAFDPAVRQIASIMQPSFKLDQQQDPREFAVSRIDIALPSNPKRAVVNANVDSFLVRAIVAHINREQIDLDDPSVWNKLASKDALDEVLATVRADPLLHHSIVEAINQAPAGSDALAIRSAILDRESVVAGTLNYLFEHKQFPQLKGVFEAPVPAIDADAIAEMRRFVDPMESFDPLSEIDRVGLSPVGMVHLFRQYFFEFDTFLGTPVQHIWLSPGSSLELVEISTRRTIIERSAETAFESTVKTEKSATEQEDLSLAIKEENQSNTKFGSSVSGGVSGGATTPIYSATAHAEASATFGSETTTHQSRESAHKHMRLQSDKLASEIKKNFKTTFKSVSEITDTNSKRYVLQNATSELKNFELRRKMRQVGVQVQDIGEQLCWQTYVDLPGSHLGLANLVHIAQPPDYSSLKAPDTVAPPDPIEKDLTVPLAFQGTGHDNDTNVHYVEDAPWSEFGHPDNGDINDKIRINYLNYQAPVIPNFELKDVRFAAILENKQATPEFRIDKAKTTFDIHLRSVNYDGDEIKLQVKLVYGVAAELLGEITKTNKTNAATFDAAKKHLAEQTLMNEARDRVKAAASIQPRRFDDLREEERIVVYRELISDLLNVGLLLDNPRVRHVMSELINSMFDVDKMLYFVAPDWWRPRKPVNQQNLGGKAPDKVFSKSDVVMWGDAGANYRANYFITEDSAPARLGSSIGWVMQLDGDNLRNAFLNAPWVKAIVPIRPGKELAALNWLSSAAVEGTDSLDARYQATDDIEHDQIVAFLEHYPWPDGPEKLRYTDFAEHLATEQGLFVSIRDALRYLALKIKLKNLDAMKVRTDSTDGEVKSYLPTEKVFEHGFYPLQGGFKAGGAVPFEVFDQWVEVLPTDQVVAVEVSYDPKTGQQL